MRSEDDLTSRAREYESVQVEVGTVGWSDRDSHYDKGNPSGRAGERHTLVCVTLFRGKDPSVRPEPGKAAGQKILARIGGGLFRIPKKGTMVYVIVPHGMEESPGASIIIATAEDDPSTQFEEDRAVLDVGVDVHLVLKGKSVTAQDHAGRFIAVGTPRAGGAAGVQVRLPDGTGAAWQDGAFGCFVRESTLVQMTPNKFEVWQGSGSSQTFLKMGGGEFWTFGPVNKMQGYCYIGKAPVALNTAATYPLAAGVPPPSASVFISLV